ncbi:MAG TPA: hypothetical protein VGG27_21055 [Magnetospirillaceae bacterium]|jgi:hypothetical protein
MPNRKRSKWTVRASFNQTAAPAGRHVIRRSSNFDIARERLAKPRPSGGQVRGDGQVPEGDQTTPSGFELHSMLETVRQIVDPATRAEIIALVVAVADMGRKNPDSAQ